jgi:hypothetical protein
MRKQDAPIVPTKLWEKNAPFRAESFKTWCNIADLRQTNYIVRHVVFNGSFFGGND